MHCNLQGSVEIQSCIYVVKYYYYEQNLHVLGHVWTSTVVQKHI